MESGEEVRSSFCWGSDVYTQKKGGDTERDGGY